MRPFDAVRKIGAKLAVIVAKPPPRSGFMCVECERWQRCGLPPDKNCIVMAMQIARNGGRPSRCAAPIEWWSLST